MTKELLWIKMLALADSGHPKSAELRSKADALRLAAESDTADLASVKKLLGAWARARTLWCECSGEPLI